VPLEMARPLTRHSAREPRRDGFPAVVVRASAALVPIQTKEADFQCPGQQVLRYPARLS